MCARTCACVRERKDGKKVNGLEKTAEDGMFNRPCSAPRYCKVINIRALTKRSLLPQASDDSLKWYGV